MLLTRIAFAGTHGPYDDRANANQIRRIKEETPGSCGGAWPFPAESSRLGVRNIEEAASIILSATSNCGVTMRTVFAVIPTSVRTTVRQHACDMFAPPQSLDISLQQSRSGWVSVCSGMKQAIWGASPQAITIVRIVARNDHDMCRVYISPTWAEEWSFETATPE